MDKQTPLRDNYVSCTEPVNPYHGNYVVVSLTKPYCLNLPLNVSNLWGTQSSGWQNIGYYSPGSLSPYSPHWQDMSRNFIMPTHCVRTWSNGGYWWNPNYYLTNYLPLRPLARSSNYAEPQVGGLMYMYAYLLGLGYRDNMPYSYSTLDYTSSTGDCYERMGNEYTHPNYLIQPAQYLFLNNDFVSSPESTLMQIAGLNLTSYVVSFQYQQPDTSPFAVLAPACFGNYLNIIIKPLVPYVDLSGCWLNPPANYMSYMHQDWDGHYILESKYGTQYQTGQVGEQIPVLPAITLGVGKSSQCFDVVLPVQLYTLAPVGSGFTFTLQDVSNGSPASPSMEVVATRIRGYFWDENGVSTNALNATQVHFELVEPLSVFHMAHTFEENLGNTNRPFYCTETNSLPIVPPLSSSTSLLFSPRCGPGMWTNLPQNN